ncbi:MAG: ECF transporter S component [Lachnospiraceae bacterium]|nr:ECF transporter S component [Lachnospiraceae bacterium]
MKTKKLNTVTMVELAVLIAVVLLMAFTPIGYIKTFGLEITLIVVPVAVGAVTLGPVAGLILGTIFGITSFIQCFGMSPFGAMLLSINPVSTFIVCVPTRMAMGWLTGMIFRGLKMTDLDRKVSTSIACLLGPFLNTFFFMSALCVCFYHTDYIQSMVTSVGATNVFAFIVAFVGLNGIVEALSCFVIGTAIAIALMSVQRNTYQSK